MRLLHIIWVHIYIFFTSSLTQTPIPFLFHSFSSFISLSVHFPLFYFLNSNLMLTLVPVWFLACFHFYSYSQYNNYYFIRAISIHLLPKTIDFQEETTECFVVNRYSNFIVVVGVLNMNSSHGLICFECSTHRKWHY